MEEKYEIEMAFFPGEWFYSLVGTLTGSSREEIAAAHAKGSGKKNARAMIETFKNLGFDCSSRFIPFDENTKYPCIMRVPCLSKTGKRTGSWYAFGYYDGFLYSFTDLETMKYPVRIRHVLGHKWVHLSNGAHPITSMIQVWVNTESKINKF